MDNLNLELSYQQAKRLFEMLTNSNKSDTKEESTDWAIKMAEKQAGNKKSFEPLIPELKEYLKKEGEAQKVRNAQERLQKAEKAFNEATTDKQKENAQKRIDSARKELNKREGRSAKN